MNHDVANATVDTVTIILQQVVTCCDQCLAIDKNLSPYCTEGDFPLRFHREGIHPECPFRDPDYVGGGL